MVPRDAALQVPSDVLEFFETARAEKLPPEAAAAAAEAARAVFPLFFEIKKRNHVSLSLSKTTMRLDSQAAADAEAQQSKKRGRKTKSPPKPEAARPKRAHATEDFSALSDRGRAAFEVAWAADFGPAWANPFRTRLTRESCAALLMPDYFDVVQDPVDLALVRANLAAGKYTSDKALRDDVARIAENAAAYHPKDSPLVGFARDLVRAFDKALVLP